MLMKSSIIGLDHAATTLYEDFQEAKFKDGSRKVIYW